MSNADFAYWKREQVGRTIAMRMGGGRYQIQPPGSLCDIHVEAGDGVMVLVKVKSIRQKTRYAHRWRGADIIKLDEAIRIFKETYPDAYVQAMAVTTWGNKFRWKVIE